MLSLIKKIFTPDSLEINEEFKMVFDAFENTPDNYFLTGNAGTGKSTLINYFRSKSKKQVVVLAPTGLAALNVKGQTIHSFFHFPPQLITQIVINRLNTTNRIYKQVDTIIIDEASMIRADLLDGIDQFLRKFGKDQHLPFGGTQMILVGDLFQLAPVVRYEEAQVLGRMYTSPFFFSALSFSSGNFIKIELNKIYRQNDEDFISLLNDIRTGDVSSTTLQTLNKRVVKYSPSRDKNTVILAATNNVVNSINLTELLQLQASDYIYKADIMGEFPITDNNLPAEMELRLRKGARVMFVKNGGQWVNGTLGQIESLSHESIQVKVDETGEVLTVEPEDWEYVKYAFNEEDNTVEAKTLGTFRQYPLRLAWAITIHKSQGMTFSKVTIDYSKSPFAHGQTYVALSRCRTLDGITLSKSLYPNDVIIDNRVVEYVKYERLPSLEV